MSQFLIRSCTFLLLYVTLQDTTQAKYFQTATQCGQLMHKPDV